MDRRLFCMTALTLLAAVPGHALAQATPVDWKKTPIRLMMGERAGCIYCADWNAKVGPGYANSPAGRIAPLLRVDLDGPYPDGLALARRPFATPTFILLRDRFELSRMEGYVPAQDFYPRLTQMMEAAGIRL